jgi:hypothetical protein
MQTAELQIPHHTWPAEHDHHDGTAGGVAKAGVGIHAGRVETRLKGDGHKPRQILDRIRAHQQQCTLSTVEIRYSVYPVDR